MVPSSLSTSWVADVHPDTQCLKSATTLGPLKMDHFFRPWLMSLLYMMPTQIAPKVTVSVLYGLALADGRFL